MAEAPGRDNEPTDLASVAEEVMKEKADKRDSRRVFREARDNALVASDVEKDDQTSRDELLRVSKPSSAAAKMVTQAGYEGHLGEDDSGVDEKPLDSAIDSIAYKKKI